MNLLCKIGYHKWKYNSQKVVLTPLQGGNLGLDDVEVDAIVRLCDRCYRKEINGFRNKWKKTNIYTKEEKRDMSLKSLLGEDE